MDPFRTREPPQTVARFANYPCKSAKADARTRTGDPFITSDRPVSPQVRSSPLRPLVVQVRVDWSGLGATGEDNLVDGWWTSKELSCSKTAAQVKLDCSRPRDAADVQVAADMDQIS